MSSTGKQDYAIRRTKPAPQKAKKVLSHGPITINEVLEILKRERQ